MENQFAKVFNFPTGQLLVTLDLNEEGEATHVTTCTHRDDVRIETIAQFKTEKMAAAVFNAMMETSAQETFDRMQNMLKK